MNWVKKNREKLSTNNYVRKADSKTNYWLDLSAGRIKYYRNLTNDIFNIIIYGNGSIETDFYVIPYLDIKHVLVDENFAKSEGRKRWIGNIVNHNLSISNSSTKINIRNKYSIDINSIYNKLIDSETSNDFAIENAKREVNIRIKQSTFRKMILDNFNHRCCLSGISEQQLLIASHIIPWSSKIETRLSPHNGVCFSILYDKLFDKGFFTINESLEVLITSRINELSKETQKWLNGISGKKISEPRKYEISIDALKYHREKIFESF